MNNSCRILSFCRKRHLRPKTHRTKEILWTQINFVFSAIVEKFYLIARGYDATLSFWMVSTYRPFINSRWVFPDNCSDGSGSAQKFYNRLCRFVFHTQKISIIDIFCQDIKCLISIYHFSNDKSIFML